MKPVLCAKGCGFYGSAETRNMCSNCYMDVLKKQIIKHSITLVDSPKSSSQNDDQVSKISAKIEDMTLNEKKKKKKKNRCKTCNKKVGYLGFKCRCDGLFCGLHRMPETHACEFDYKSTNSSNPHLILVKADKLYDRI